MIRPSLIALGLIIGVGLGLLYGWVISPVEYTETDPSSFSQTSKEQYIVLVASAYKADGNLDRARSRLLKLKDENLIALITALAQRAAAEGQDSSGLAVLAADLVGGPQPVGSATQVAVTTPDPILPTETVTPPAPVASETSISTFPTPSPTATPDYDYVLVTSEPYCDDEQRLPLIIVDVVDAEGAPLPGVRVVVQWPDGQDGFVTGLKPEISPSYGDFLMEVGTSYSVQIGTRTPPVTGLSAPSCVSEVSNNQYAGAMRLVFQRK